MRKLSVRSWETCLSAVHRESTSLACLRDKVAQDAAHWSSTAKFLTNWIARLLVLYFFVTTLAGFRDLIAGILNSKLPIAKILKDLVKTMQIKTVPDAGDDRWRVTVLDDLCLWDALEPHEVACICTNLDRNVSRTCTLIDRR